MTLKSVIEKLKKLDHLYYNEGESPVSDVEYDELKEKTKKSDPTNPYFSEVGSPTVGKKISLPFVLGSLNKVKPDSVEKWSSGRTGLYSATAKVDGISILVNYIDGRVTQAMTRGNGSYGTDITDKAQIFCPNFKKFMFPGSSWLRGEATLIGDTYKKLGYKNRRNVY